MNIKNYGKGILCLLPALLVVGLLTLGLFAPSAAAQPQNAEEMRVALGQGWNMGNTLDAHIDFASPAWYPLEELIAGREWNMTPIDYKNFTAEDIAYYTQYETYWGNPPITPETIKAVKNAGFTAIRLPVTWYDHLDKNNNINPIWMARVRQVVDAILAENLYVIVNIHHDGIESDGGWLVLNSEVTYDASRVVNGVYNPTPEEQARFAGVKARFAAIWRQIATTFKNYDERLLFAGMNEVSGYSATDPAYSYALGNINLLNQLFVDTVRATGDANAGRFLIVPTYYAASWSSTILDAFTMPNDSVADKLLVEVHAYSPWEYTGSRSTNPSDWQWSDSVKSSLDYLFWLMDQYEYPFVIGEWGVSSLIDLLDADDAALRYAGRLEYTKYYMDNCRARGIPTFHWDDGTLDSFALFDRVTMAVAYPEVVTLLTQKTVAPPPVFTGLEVTPNPLSIERGKTVSLTVEALWSDGNAQDVTSAATYRTANRKVATVTAGVVKAMAKGTTTITVTWNGKSVTAPVTVTEPQAPVTLTSLTVRPSSLSLKRGQSGQLSVVAAYSNRSTKTVTTDCEFTTNKTSVATVSASGLVKAGQLKGNATITVTYSGKTTTVAVRVK